MNRNVLLLALSQALMMTVVSLVLSSSALVGISLSVSAGLATVPLAAQYLATMLSLHVLSSLMARFGRRPVFIGGALVGAAGLTLAVIGILLGSFVVFALAGLGVGVLGAAGQFYRFAAVDAVPPEQKGQAISLTLTGGVLAAFLGPFIARNTRDWLGTPFLGSFLVLVGVALLAALLAFFLRLPSPLPAAALRQPRPLREIARQGRFRLALAGGVVGYAIMNLLMTATPLAMMCARLDFAATATVIQWHLVAMFAPSFLTGSLIRRLGVLQVMLLGGALTLAAIGVALSGDELFHFGIALALVGIGWNFMYVGATTLLTETYREEEKALVQAGNDGLVFLGVTVATLSAGPLVDGLGWEWVNAAAVLPVLLVMAGVLIALRRTRPVLASSA